MTTHTEKKKPTEISKHFMKGVYCTLLFSLLATKRRVNLKLEILFPLIFHPGKSLFGYVTVSIKTVRSMSNTLNNVQNKQLAND